MARRNEKVENFTKQLIVAVTGFAEDEENFDLCMQYATYNLKYHKCLDADSHKIKRTLQGLYDKFRVHCQDEKADILKKNVQRFLDIPQFEHREHGTTDTHWAVISLLLALSDSPTKVVYQERKKKPKKDVNDDFDWTAYLLEGEDIFIHPNYESPELSEDEEDSTFSVSPHIKFKRTNEVTDESHMTQQEVEVILEHPESDEAWLQRNLMVEYWRGEVVPMDIAHRSANLTHDWESHMTASSAIYVPAQKTVVTEYQIVRETLWILSGARDSFIYNICEECCSVSSQIKVCHLTDSSLYSILSTFAKYATILFQLQHLVDSLTSMNIFAENQADTVYINCQTYQAFAYCIAKYLSEFKKMLVILEKNTAQQVEPASISWLQHHLTQFFSELDLLEHILTNGVLAVSHVTSVPERSAHLLTVIYNTLLSCDTMGENSLIQVSLLLPLWVQTCKPYLDVIDNWICNGVLQDPRKEFIIQRNEKVQCLNETFWDTAFTLHCTQSKYSSQPPSETGSESEDVSQTTQNPHAPYFLLPVLREIVLAGKSMEMLESLGRKSEFVENKEKGTVKRSTLYETFVQSMETFLGTFENDDDLVSKDTDETAVPPSTKSPPKRDTFKENIHQQMQIKEIKDPLLRLNFEKIFNTKDIEAESLTEKEDQVERRLKGLRLGGTNGMSPIQLVVQECLYPHIRQRYTTVCKGLLRILKEEFMLMDYLGAMRKFYLMEVGDTMYDFYTEIFEKLRHGETWQDVSYLTMLLQEALTTHYPEQVDRLSICISGDESKTKSRQPVTALEGLSLHYKVPWPVDVVLNKKAITIYNQVFAFLLQIKRAKFCLDGLRFSDLEKEDLFSKSVVDESFLESSHLTTPLPRKQLLHQMHILRVRFMTFVNSLHQYIMTRILHSTGLEFQTDIEKATDLDELISVHRKYLATIHERCLQHRGVHMIRDIVMKVLNLALQFQKIWDDGASHLSARIVKEMDVEFSRCLKFLASVLNNAIKRGSFPHLESLAFSLITFLEQKT